MVLAHRIKKRGSVGGFTNRQQISCPYDAVYAATKSYILSVSKGINAELKGTGVTITTLCPGSAKTEFAAKADIVQPVGKLPPPRFGRVEAVYGFFS